MEAFEKAAPEEKAPFHFNAVTTESLIKEQVLEGDGHLWSPENVQLLQEKLNDFCEAEGITDITDSGNYERVKEFALGVLSVRDNVARIDQQDYQIQKGEGGTMERL